MATTNDAHDGRDRIDATAVHEGDRVTMAIGLHGSVDISPGIEFDRDLFKSGVTGTVTEAPTEREREMMRDGDRPMTDFAVEDDDGNVFRWNVDNGYVLGHHNGLDRRTDIGRFSGFYEAE